jgi:hypothetical protein
MKLAPIAQNIVVRSYMRALLENISGDASAIQKQVVSLANELKADGEDITDEESNNADEIERIFITEINNKNNNTKKADPSTLKNAAESFKNS